MKKRILSITFALMMVLALLAGCTLHNKTLDPVMQRTVEALNQNDMNALRAMISEDTVDDAAFTYFAEHLSDYWQPTEPEALRLVKLNVQKSPGQTTWSGGYLLPDGAEYNFLSLVYTEDAEGHGELLGLHLDQVDETQAAGISVHSPFGVAGLIYNLLCFAFIVFTIVDIARKRPIKYGWYIVLALVSFYMTFNGVRFSAPLGSIIYWAIRKGLLEKKAARDAALAAQDMPENAPENAPERAPEPPDEPDEPGDL